MNGKGHKKTRKKMYATEAPVKKSVAESRSFDGSGNNLVNDHWGRANEPLRRKPTRPDYDDGISKPRKGPNPRAISNAVCIQQPDSGPHPQLSSFMWAWGQFVDHEIDLSLESDNEHLDIKVPANDDIAPGDTIPFGRSEFAAGTGVKGVPREQVNVLSAYVDGANVYGASLERALALRALDGTGRMKVSHGKHGDLLPKNTQGLANAQGPLRDDDPPEKFFLAGDVRANEHSVLTCMHTLFVREHNRNCDELAYNNSARLAREIKALGRDEAIFRRARRIVIAIEQIITYEEFLPALLGPKSIPRYKGYQDDVDATIANVFSTASYRLGHDMLNSRIALVDPWGEFKKSISLDRSFFQPEQVSRLGIDVFLAGLSQTNMERINCQCVEDIRSNLFNVNPKLPSLLLDLAALNIQRGRDHGLPDYNQCRADYGLKKVRRFEDITSDEERVCRLKKAYRNVNEIDPWIGGLCEDPHGKAIVGELFFAILCDQFLRLRDGDRFWYENDPGLTQAEIRKLRKTRLSTVIKRNSLIDKIQPDVFRT